MSGCDAALRWGESRLIHTHRALRSGRIEQRKCRLRVDSFENLGTSIFATD
jgi:hypothetical protein